MSSGLSPEWSKSGEALWGRTAFAQSESLAPRREQAQHVYELCFSTRIARVPTTTMIIPRLRKKINPYFEKTGVDSKKFTFRSQPGAGSAKFGKLIARRSGQRGSLERSEGESPGPAQRGRVLPETQRKRPSVLAASQRDNEKRGKADSEEAWSGTQGKAQEGAGGPGWVFPELEALEPRREQAQRKCRNTYAQQCKP